MVDKLEYHIFLYSTLRRPDQKSGVLAAKDVLRGTPRAFAQSVQVKNYYDRADGSGRVAFSVLAED
jgi:hypothetical protein